MKATENFKKTIFEHLDSVADKDDLFLVNFKNPKKNIDDCITYILNEVQKSGVNGFTDEEIFGMAIHYYDEDQIEIGKPISGRVVVNHIVEITPEEIAEQKQKALDKIFEEEKRRMTKKVNTEKEVVTESVQGSLF